MHVGTWGSEPKDGPRFQGVPGLEGGQEPEAGNFHKVNLAREEQSRGSQQGEVWRFLFSATG